jgi:nitroimidazol reductase NimA-like FMN-containing flavoprotein (pyridoxamine 5'-phosphate oxidase superfamily)
MQDSIEKAKALISSIPVVTLATVTKEGLPWNTPVTTAHDAHYTFYWASWSGNQHSVDIQHNPNVFIVIYNPTASQQEGVYIQAKAYEITDEEEIRSALACFSEHSPLHDKQANEFRGEYPQRMYKAVPETFWVNGPGGGHGKYVDLHVPAEKLYTPEPPQ